MRGPIFFYNAMAGALKRLRLQILCCEHMMRVRQSRGSLRQSLEHHLRVARRRSIGMKGLSLARAKPVAGLYLPSRMKKRLQQWCWLNRTLRSQITRAVRPNPIFFLKLFFNFATVIQNKNGNLDPISQLFKTPIL